VVVDTKTEELEVAWGLLGLIVIVITVTNIYWASVMSQALQGVPDGAMLPYS